jgi:hypothetical protein
MVGDKSSAWWCSGQKWSNARAGKWWHWCWKVRGGARASEEGQGWTKSKPKSVWASNLLLPARCLIKCPQEKSFQIWEFPLVDCIHIIFEVDWWWWFSFWWRFARIQNVDHLLFISKSSLVHSILVNLVNFSSDGQQRSCSLWLGLGWHGHSWPSLV